MRRVQIGGQLRDGHGVAGGQGIEPDEGREARVRQIPFHHEAAERIRAVQHDHGDASPRARLHAERGGPQEGVIPGSHVLQVDDEGVDLREHRRAGGQLSAVETPDGQSRGAVPQRSHSRVVLGRAGDAVLGGEERGEPRAADPADGGHRVGQFTGDRGLVAEEPHAASSEKHGQPAHEHVEAGADPRHGLL